MSAAKSYCMTESMTKVHDRNIEHGDFISDLRYIIIKITSITCQHPVPYAPATQSKIFPKFCSIPMTTAINRISMILADLLVVLSDP